jgi:thioredoxin 1
VNNESNKKSLSIWIRVLILLLIFAAIAVIYGYKKSEENKKGNQNIVQDNADNKEEAVDNRDVNTDNKEESNDNSEEDNDIIEGEVLPLAISSVDLDSIMSYGLPVVIDFGSDTCRPCIAMAPVLETLYEEWQGKAIVHFIDVWKYTSAADDFPVTLIPTQVFYQADSTPFTPSEELTKEIEFTMYYNKNTKEHVFTVHQGGITEEEMKKIFAEMGVE